MKNKVDIRMVLLLKFVLAGFASFSQGSGELEVTLLKSEQRGDSCIYNVTIKNLSDSVACVLHSMFVNLKSKEPQGLPLHFQKSPERFYSLGYSFRDTAFEFESTPYRGECILPYQCLQFKLMIVTGNEIGKQLNIEHLYVPDFCYKDFMKEMQQMTTWYMKYKRKENKIKLPQ